MKTQIDYSNSPCKNFDAVEDIKDYFGPKWDKVSGLMSAVRDVELFEQYANFGGVEGFPVKAWYDLYFGGGAYDKAWDVVAERAEQANAQ